MFTGLVEEAGVVIQCLVNSHTAKITLEAQLVHLDAKLGDSVAVNGCCLTVVEILGNRLTFDAVPETLARTNLGGLKPGSRVNLERPLQVGARLGGHFVQGHIDGKGSVISVIPEENAVIIEIGIPAQLRRYFIEKGSITVDGVSLTVAEVRPDSFTFWMIPHTRDVTTLSELQAGDSVNLECDLLGKYMESLLSDRLDSVVSQQMALESERAKIADIKQLST